MFLLHIDEAGCPGALPSSISPVQPVFVVAGIVFPQGELARLTPEFLHLKSRFFPALARGRAFLDCVLAEVKGSDIRRDACSSSRRVRRHALGFLDKYVELLEQAGVRILGRAWVKGIGRPFDGRAVYTSSIQSLCQGFQMFLEGQDDRGFVICDSRTSYQNANVSHSIFTQKYQAAGDRYSRVLEMPTFGQSENHVGIQLADLLCSALLFPLAVYGYCQGHVNNIHVRTEYGHLKSLFGVRLLNLQYRYQDSTRVRGGITVSDEIGHRSGVLMFR